MAALPCASIRIGFVTFTDEEAVEKVLKASEEDLVLDTRYHDDNYYEEAEITLGVEYFVES